MEDLIKKLTTEPEKAIEALSAQKPDFEKIKEYREEYHERARNLRETQVGKIQRDKPIKDKPDARYVRSVVAFCKKIVRTATAFEIGEPVTLVPSVEGKLSRLVEIVWDLNRVDSLLLKAVELKKAETQVAIECYMTESSPNGLFAKLLAAAASVIGIAPQKNEINVKLLTNEDGQAVPFFDAYGKMKYFMWRFSAKVGDKDVNYVYVWDELNRYELDDLTGKMSFTDKKPHGFDRIPIVYMQQDEPEWFDAKESIDRYETIMSKLGGSNDRTSYPIMKTFGELGSLPNANDDGKVLNFKIYYDEEGHEIKGDAEYLVSPAANESIDLELRHLKSDIYSMTSTVDTSSDKMFEMGAISGRALKLLFMDAAVKAKMNEGENRTAIQRLLNIIISGIAKTTNTSLANDAKSLYYQIQFNSILPDDLSETVETLSAGVGAKIISRRAAVKMLDMTDDVDQEMEDIKGTEQQQKQQL